MRKHLRVEYVGPVARPQHRTADERVVPRCRRVHLPYPHSCIVAAAEQQLPVARPAQCVDAPTQEKRAKIKSVGRFG